MQFNETGQLSVTRARVTDNKDPNKQGRVKVIYPSFSGDSGQLPSEWARLCHSFASKGSGSWFVPEIGDEVLVAFDGPSLDHPIILGSLYGASNNPPSTGKSGDFNSDGKNNLRFIRSKSGNFLAFDDSPGKEGIHISDKEGAQLKLEKGKVALGTQAGELFELIEQLLDVISQNAPTMVSTSVGPGVLNPSILSKVNEVKSKIGQMKGKLG
jgi:uncharacterized protein involved in type VI secretion and phage assembly